jgi:hypothetical protein
MSHGRFASRLQTQSGYAAFALTAASAGAFLSLSALPSCGSGFQAGHDASDLDTNEPDVVALLEAGFPDTGSSSSDAKEETHPEDAKRPKDAEGDVTQPNGDTGPAGCDPANTPENTPSVISESCGLFVAPPANGGNDTTGLGTRASPFATLGAAIPKAAAAHLRVYVCGATYPEAVSIGTSGDGVAIYGGLACPTVADGGGVDAGMVHSRPPKTGSCAAPHRTHDDRQRSPSRSTEIPIAIRTGPMAIRGDAHGDPDRSLR